MRRFKSVDSGGTVAAIAVCIGTMCGCGGEPDLSEPSSGFTRQLETPRGDEREVVLAGAPGVRPSWRGIREGVSVETRSSRVDGDPPESVIVAYKRTRMKPAGAAMPLSPGTLSGLRRVELRLQSKRSQRLIVSLRDSDGVVWSFPSMHVPVGESVERVLDVSDIAPDAYQNRTTVTGSFDAAKIIMVMVLDIGGYMSIDEPECEWAIETAKGVCR